VKGTGSMQTMKMSGGGGDGGGRGRGGGRPYQDDRDDRR
jgi:hypothetical protein